MVIAVRGEGVMLSVDVSTQTGANDNMGMKVLLGGNSGGTNMYLWVSFL